MEGTLRIRDITAYIQALFQEDTVLQDLWLEGEISNFVQARSGHCYFTLKDDVATLKAVMWKQSAHTLSRLPRNGEAVVAHGYIGIYPERGEYQLYADFLRPAGLGDLYQQFLRLKEKLAAEGLFAEERKKPVPPFPHRIGVVTSPTGAAFRDIVRVIRGRFPALEIDLFPTEVQGEAAPAKIVAALHNAAAYGVDVIILARGGGSLEDLWSFNDEAMVRTVAALPVPVISGVGHETDFTLVDFAADRRTPTPSAAAAAATPDGVGLRESILTLRSTLYRQIDTLLSAKREAVQARRHTVERYEPRVRLTSARQRLDDLNALLGRNFSFQQRLRRQRLHSLREKLASLNPRAVLARGYALVQDEEGQLVRDADSVRPGQKLRIEVYRGQFSAVVAEEKEV